MEGFHHRVAQRIAGMSYGRVVEGGWEWSSVAEALEAAWMWPMKEYIWRQYATITEYIANQPIYEISTGAKRMPISGRLMQC